MLLVDSTCNKPFEGFNEEETPMADTPVAITKFETKSHNSPDEVRTPNKTRVEVVRLPGYTLGRLNFEPGWKGQSASSRL